MIWREIKIGAFIFALCTLAAVATLEIYDHASGTTTSAWLLLPVFMLITVAILALELLAKRAKAEVKAEVKAEIEADDCVQINRAISTWSSPVAGITVVVFILSLPPVLPQTGVKERLHETEVRFVATIAGQAIQCTEPGTYS